MRFRSRQTTDTADTIDTPASKPKLFIAVILILAALFTMSYKMLSRSRHSEPPPKIPLNEPLPSTIL